MREALEAMEAVLLPRWKRFCCRDRAVLLPRWKRFSCRDGSGLAAAMKAVSLPRWKGNRFCCRDGSGFCCRDGSGFAEALCLREAREALGLKRRSVRERRERRSVCERLSESGWLTRSGLFTTARSGWWVPRNAGGFVHRRKERPVGAARRGLVMLTAAGTAGCLW